MDAQKGKVSFPNLLITLRRYGLIWYCYCFLSGSKCAFSYIVQYSLYHNMDIGTMWHCTMVSSAPSQFIGLCIGCALLWCWVSLGAPVTIFLIELYFIMIFMMIIVTIIGILMAINYFLNYILVFRYLSSSGSANAQLPGCFRLWTFSLNIGLNMFLCVLSLFIRCCINASSVCQLVNRSTAAKSLESNQLCTLLWWRSYRTRTTSCPW